MASISPDHVDHHRHMRSAFLSSHVPFHDANSAPPLSPLSSLSDAVVVDNGVSNDSSSNSSTEGDPDGQSWGSWDDLPLTDGTTPPVTLERSSKNTYGQSILLQPSQLIFPKSRYQGHLPLLPVCNEITAVEELSKAARLQGNYTGQEFQLSDFSIYLPPDTFYHSYEMRGLQYLTLFGHGVLHFDGILSIGNTRRYVESVPFKICSIG